MRSNKILLAIIFPALVIQTIGAYFYFIAFAQTPAAPLIYGITKLILFFLPIVLLSVGFRFGPFLQTRHLASSAGTGIIFGTVVAAAMFVLVRMNEQFFLVFAPNFIDATNNFGIQGYFIQAALLFSIFHSLLEEYYWRWFVFGGLKSALSFHPAAIISSLAFSAHHFIVLSQFFSLMYVLVFGTLIFFGGIFWCWMYDRYKTLWGNWISHAILDGAIFALGYLLMNAYVASAI